MQIHLTTKDGEADLALSAAVDGLAAATASGRDAVLLVAEDRLSEIREKLDALRTAEPLPAEGEDAAAESDDPD